MSDDRFVNAVAGYRGHLLALAAGAFMPLAFSPFGLYPLAVLLIAVLFFVCCCTTPRQAALRGLLFGIGMFGFGVTWIYISIHVYGYVNAPLSAFITALLVMVLALFPAFFSYFAARNHRNDRRGFADPLRLVALYPALWVLFEWVRGWFFTGFPWLSLGYSQTDSALAGYAPLLGVYGVSWIVALSAGLLLVVLFNRVKKWRLCSALALAILWGGGALGNLLEWGEPVGEPIKVSIIQGNIGQEIKWLSEMRQPTLDLYAKLTREHWDSDLIIWPESALPDFYHRAGSFIDALGQEARAHDTDILLGVLSLHKNPLRYYNSMVSAGSRRALYHKQHLVPFTEYLPLKELLMGIVDFMQVPMSDFSGGAADQPLLRVAGHPVGISICFEVVFGEEVIRALPEAELLVNVSNDAWFGTSIGPVQHLQIARMRALETRRPVIRATNTGISAVIGAHGELQAVAPQFETYVLTTQVQPRSGSTPYVVWGNWLIVILMMTILAVVGCIKRAARGVGSQPIEGESKQPGV